MFRRKTSGRCSASGFLWRTKSAIRQGLYDVSPLSERIVHNAPPVIDEDEMLRLDDVKVSLFTGPDLLSKD